MKEPWKPGESGNPSGTPKGGEGFAARLREKAGEGGKVLAEWLFEIAEHAEPGDRLKAISLIADRAFGKVKETLDVTGSLTLEQLIVEAHKSATVTVGGDVPDKVT